MVLKEKLKSAKMGFSNDLIKNNYSNGNTNQKHQTRTVRIEKYLRLHPYKNMSIE